MAYPRARLDIEWYADGRWRLYRGVQLPALAEGVATSRWRLYLQVLPAAARALWARR